MAFSPRKLMRGASGAQNKDAQFNYVTMLLHGDGTNGAQNNTFLDSSTNNFTITRNGNTTQGSFSPYGSNWSNYFDGDGDYITVPDNAAFTLGTSNFTIEFLVYPLSGGGTSPIIFEHGQSGDWGAWIFQWISQNEIYFYAASSAGAGSYNVCNQSFGTLAKNQWTHICVTRSGSTFTGYKNGTSVFTSTSALGIQDQTAPVTIGRHYNSSSQDFNGYVSNARIVVGSVVTPPAGGPTSPLTAVTNTVLLTCQSNRFVDNSTNNFTVTATGSPSVQRFNPFGTSTAYDTSVIGGSGYFDGSGDYLTSTWSVIGANQFTCEVWVYIPDNSGRYYIVAPGTDTASHYDGFGFEIFNGYLSMWASSNGSSWNLVTSDTSQGRSANLITPNVWTHVVMTRDSGGVFRSFINGNLQCTVSPGTAALADSGTTVLNVGRTRYTGDYANFSGYMSNLRIVNGSVVTAYATSSTTVGTQIFTSPTAPLTAITNTSLLINFTNGAIFDNAMVNNLETVGNAQISTSVVKYGTGSLYFDGTGDFLQTPSTPNTNLGSGNFTVECWFYKLSTKTASCISLNGALSSNGYALGESSTNPARLWWYSQTTRILSNTNFAYNTWNHVAVVRNGSTTTMYQNGVNVGSFTDSINYSGTILYVGSDEVGSQEWNGYLDEVRITKGYARYTANFTPPTAALSDTGPY